jgi:hypothetical protein
VDGNATGAPDGTGTSLFMPIEVLKGPRPPFRLHEAVFWLGFFTLINRSVTGRARINEITKGDYAYQQLATTKVDMLLGASRSREWTNWFSGPGDQNELDIARSICGRLMEIQFPNL